MVCDSGSRYLVYFDDCGVYCVVAGGCGVCGGGRVGGAFFYDRFWDVGLCVDDMAESGAEESRGIEASAGGTREA